MRSATVEVVGHNGNDVLTMARLLHPRERVAVSEGTSTCLCPYRAYRRLVMALPVVGGLSDMVHGETGCSEEEGKAEGIRPWLWAWFPFS